MFQTFDYLRLCCQKKFRLDYFLTSRNFCTAVHIARLALKAGCNNLLKSPMTGLFKNADEQLQLSPPWRARKPVLATAARVTVHPEQTYTFGNFRKFWN